MPREHVKTTIEPQQPRYLPVGCDLSFGSLQFAIDMGKEHNLGTPKFVLIGPENKFPAIEIMGDPRKKYSSNNEFNALSILYWEIIRSMPMYTWKVVFERGVVISEGPR